MKSKAILPEDERAIYRPIEDENPETVAYQNKDAWILLEALEAAEQELQEDKEAFLKTLISREDEIHKHISHIQDLEKEIENYVYWAKNNVPELVKMLKNRKG